ncbi:lipopolysaccharide assembly protein LapB [Desulfovibrio sp. X2]|uniref:tetratricopeptide repeat protein n=1 Tax=Desulfovibrio sp. X2 TaxID=941449 RepID=UPI001F3C2D1F|nr:tetratricopeptide repeat protein [Desulfovibrio sp. X2]
MSRNKGTDRGARWISLLAGLLLAFSLIGGCSPKPPKEDVLEKASRAYDQGLYLEAETFYEEYLQKNPGDSRRWQAWNRLLDIVSVIRGDNEKAHVILEAMLLEFGSEPDKARAVLIKQGDLLQSEGHLDQAVESWQKAQRLGPSPEPDPCLLSLRFSRAYTTEGHYDLAQDSLRECLSEAKEPSCLTRCRYELAQTYGLQENWPQEAELLEQVIASATISKEDKSSAIYLLADAYANSGQVERAKKLLQSILATYPNPKAVQTKLDQLNHTPGKK